MLEREGLKVLPASLDGLRLLAEAVNTGPRSAREPDFDESPPYPDLLRQQPALWKERDEPPPNQARRLVTHLRRFLGPAGFELLCACAVYPVMQWGVTLFFAYELLGRDKVDVVLPRLLRLPWFRHGTMPPWLRRTLVSELPRARRRLVRERLEHLLLVFLEEPERGLAPRSTGELAAHDDALASLPARLGERLAAWRRSRRLRDRLEHVTARSPLTEPVFFNFITDNRPRPATFSFVSSRRATFTFIFFGAYVFLYLLMWLSGGATGAVLTAYGAMVNYLIDQEGQWWLFVTPIFLHEHLPGLGPLHLLSSMFWLYMFGPYVEKLYGSARFCVFWILTGIAGVVASYLAVRPEWAHGALGQFLFKAYDSPSTGVAGTFFGLMGVLFVFAIKHRDELPARLKRTLWIRLLPIFFIHFFIGYMWPFLTDNAMHLSGLVVGMGLALAVGYKRPGARGPVEYAWHAAQVACLLLVAVSFVMVARNLDSPPPRLSDLRERAAGTSPVIPYIEAVNSGQNALSKLMSGDTGALDRAAEMLEKTPALSPEADALREELKALVARARHRQRPVPQTGRARRAPAPVRHGTPRLAGALRAVDRSRGRSVRHLHTAAGSTRGREAVARLRVRFKNLARGGFNPGAEVPLEAADSSPTFVMLRGGEPMNGHCHICGASFPVRASASSK